MTMQNGSKLNQLARELPEGLIVDAAWMERRGYSRSLRSQYVAAGWLEQPVRGTYRRPRGRLGWEQVVTSLQALLEFPVSIGGRTALEMQGYAHYLAASSREIHLYADAKPPGWLAKLPLDEAFVVHNRARFLPPVNSVSVDLAAFANAGTWQGSELPGALRLAPRGQWSWPLIVSTPERAILELADQLPHNESFHLVDVAMEGLVDLSPRRIQALLCDTTSIKVKRLFFFFAERHRHAWLKHIDRKDIDLGKGKRMLVKGGKFDSRYQITVPEDLDAVQ